MSDLRIERQLDEWLDEAVEKKASDMDFLIGKPPILKVGARRLFMDAQPLTDHFMLGLVNVLYPNAAEEMARSRTGVAAAYRRIFRNLPVGHPDRGKANRFRVNIVPGLSVEGGFGMHITMRVIPGKVPLPHEIGLPEEIIPYFRHRNGLVLVTGPTNCHTPGHLIRMADGTHKAIEQINPLTDLVMGWDYLPRRVRNIHRGESDMVRIRGIGDDLGRPLEAFSVTADHLLPVALQSVDLLRCDLSTHLVHARDLPEDRPFYLVQRARDQFLLRRCVREPGVQKGFFAGVELAQVTDKLYQDATGIIHHNSGKSTALASVIRFQAEREAIKFLTLENPIEFPLSEIENIKSTIYQVEVPTHVKSFKRGIEEYMRHSPDVILVGEMRDAETMSAGILASVAGHQVMGTLHSIGFANTINRIVNNLPPEDAAAMRHDLIDSLRFVFTQQLLPTQEGERTAVREWLVCDAYVRKKLHEAAEKNTLQKTGHELVWRFGRPIMDDVERSHREGRILDVDYENFRRDFGGK
ncbi:Flp pilus assembly complex ATPase component TadA [Acidithiobacillus thiooxidans]|uniref:ATPase, T2SS/T4P/T4SS family n=1 Tax=Acidithiobacillus thiooxidans TaxID=930 RepID=UPI001C07B0F2|nr:ATPase, T2SS/T4P/T4SS family [Acidithiobacillus thiooxidans]MBU2838932.1 Flp pilus assembly complex ATPase component TadA [Acidithiobacillus thiooxidans]